jgi:hypothetical protein
MDSHARASFTPPCMNRKNCTLAGKLHSQIEEPLVVVPKNVIQQPAALRVMNFKNFSRMHAHARIMKCHPETVFIVTEK